jgi:hypothetical protein
MRTLDLLADSWLGGAALQRPGLMLATGAGKGGSSRKGKGKADDDDLDEDEDEDEDEDDEDEDDEDDDLADLDEDELKAELRKTREALARSSSANAAKRKRLKQREAELLEARKGKPASKGKGKGGEDEDAPDLDVVREQARAEVKAEADTRIKKAEARGALKAAGIPAAQVGQLVGLIKLDDIDVDDSGEVDEDSLDEAIDALRKSWPQLFEDKTKRRRQSVAGDSDRDGKHRASGKKPTTTQLQVAAALGKPIKG